MSLLGLSITFAAQDVCSSIQRTFRFRTPSPEMHLRASSSTHKMNDTLKTAFSLKDWNLS